MPYPVLPDFLKALELCATETWRHFNVFGIWGVADELAEERELASPLR